VHSLVGLVSPGTRRAERHRRNVMFRKEQWRVVELSHYGEKSRMPGRSWWQPGASDFGPLFPIRVMGSGVVAFGTETPPSCGTHGGMDNAYRCRKTRGRFDKNSLAL